MTELEALNKELNEVKEDMFMEEMKDYIDWAYYKTLEEKEKSIKSRIALLEGK